MNLLTSAIVFFIAGITTLLGYPGWAMLLVVLWGVTLGGKESR